MTLPDHVQSLSNTCEKWARDISVARDMEGIQGNSCFGGRVTKL